MSRIGKHPVPVPSGVTVTIDGATVKAKGKLGELSMVVHDDVSAVLDDGKVTVAPRNDKPKARALYATTRSLINNMVVGVSEGFTKTLEINGVGYRAQLQGKNLVLALGFSHDVTYPAPDGIEFKVPKPTEVQITGADRQQVGQVASEIRGFRPPEPYKGKGVKYAEETILRKEGKKK